jgi:hypothetical protein
MKTRLTVATLIIGLVLVIIYGYDSYIDDQKYTHNPINMGSYEITDHYRINPNTILASLNRGETDVFLPLQGELIAIEEFPDVSISWTQANYLQIANALSQFVWEEPLDFNGWKVYSIHFRTDCQGTGFDYGEITYYKTYGISWRKGYTTRHIEIDPYFGAVRWGDQESYPQPILFNKWNSLDLSVSEVTADDALRIANENGGREARLKEGNKCYYTNLRAPVSVTGNNDEWRVSFISDHLFFEIRIDPYTGRFEVQTPSE